MTRGLSIKAPLKTWLLQNTQLFSNASSLVATTIITSGLGFIYWWLATRFFTAEIIGIVSSLSSTMLLLATIGVLGLDNFLISEIPKRKSPSVVITTSIWLSFLTASLLGLGFGILGPYLGEDLRQFFASPSHILIFGLGVGFTSATMIIDKALVGYLLSSIQLWRNSLFAILKLISVFFVAAIFADSASTWLLLTWVLSTALSALVLIFSRDKLEFSWKAKWSSLSGFQSAVTKHYLLNLVQYLPSLILPTIVIIYLGAEQSAAFYITWMFISIGRTISLHIATVFHSVAGHEPDKARNSLRSSLLASFALAFALWLFLELFGGFILSIFGKEYAVLAGESLTILAFSLFPIIIQNHYAALARVNHFVGRAIIFIAITSFAKIAAAAYAANLGSLTTMSYVLVFIMVTEGVLLAPFIWPFLRNKLQK